MDVHHIVPEGKGGTDDIDNAAPLCPNCHNHFGDNPNKRKEIRQMRDWWYGVCSKKHMQSEDIETSSKLALILEKIQRSESNVVELKDMLRRITNRMIDNITPETATMTASGITNIAVATSAVRLGEKTYSNFHCSKCNTTIGLLVGTDKCPTCGEKIS